jgi:hypothetical protein
MLHGDMRTSIMFGRAGNILSPQELANFRRKAGLCATCGITKTHTRSKRRLYVMSMRPITDEHSYKGHCLRCGGGIARVKESLGEQPTAKELAEANRSYRGRHNATSVHRAGRSHHDSDSHSRSRNGVVDSTGNMTNTTNTSVSSGSSEGGGSFCWNASNERDRDARRSGSSNGSSPQSNIRRAAPMEPCDDDSILPVADRAHKFHIVDTGAFHLRHSDPSISSCGRTVESLALDSEAMSRTGSILGDEQRESRIAEHLLGRLNRTGSWDGSMPVHCDDGAQSGGGKSLVDFLSVQLEKVAEDDEETVERKENPGKGDDLAILQNISENGDLNDIFLFMTAHKTNPAVVSVSCRKIRDRAPREQMALASEMRHGGAGNEVVPPTLRRGATLAVINILPAHWAKSLFSDMETHIGNGQLLGEIVHTVWIVSSLHNRFKSDICDCGGIDVVSDTMRCHPNNEALQVYGCGLFSSVLSSDIDVAYLRGSSGVVFETLLSVAARSEATASACALRALFLMGSSSDEAFYEMFQRPGVVDSIVDVLMRHTSSLAVQDLAITLLWALSNRSRCKIPTALKLSSKLITSIKSAVMNNHKDNRMILLSALGLLCSLSSDVPEEYSMVIPRSLIDVSADTIICALKDFPVSTALVHRYACRTILHIAQLPLSGSRSRVSPVGFKELLGEKGAIDIILKRTLQKPWFDNALLADACDALTSICIGMPSIKEAIIAKDGIRIAIDILHANAGLLTASAKDARQSACWLLSSLAACTKGIAVMQQVGVDGENGAMMQQVGVDGDENGATSPNPLVLNLLANRCGVERNNGVDSFVSVLSHVKRVKKSSVDEVEYSLLLIFSLTGSKECVDILSMSQGALQKILTWMEAFPDSIVVQKTGLGIFRALHIEAHVNDQVGSLRVISIIFTAIRIHRCHQGVQDEALLCLGNYCILFAEQIASDPAAISALLDGIDDIIETMRANKDSSVLHVNTLSLLWTLTELSTAFHPRIRSCGGIKEALLILDSDFDTDVHRQSLGFLAATSSNSAAA